MANRTFSLIAGRLEGGDEERAAHYIADVSFLSQILGVILQEGIKKHDKIIANLYAATRVVSEHATEVKSAKDMLASFDSVMLYGASAEGRHDRNR